MLEAGHKHSMEEMTTTKLSDAEGLEMDRLTERRRLVLGGVLHLGLW